MAQCATCATRTAGAGQDMQKEENFLPGNILLVSVPPASAYTDEELAERREEGDDRVNGLMTGLRASVQRLACLF